MDGVEKNTSARQKIHGHLITRSGTGCGKAQLGLEVNPRVADSIDCVHCNYQGVLRIGVEADRQAIAGSEGNVASHASAAAAARRKCLADNEGSIKSDPHLFSS